MSLLEPYLFVAAVTTIIAGLSYRTRRRHARIGEAWREAARLADLTAVFVETRGRVRLKGQSGTREVRFDHVPGRRQRSSLVVRVAPGIRLKAEHWDTALEKVIGIRELQIGDKGFDGDIHLQGLPEVLRASLDAETRGLLRELVRGWGVSLQERELSAPLPAPILEEPAALAALLKSLLDLAGRLDRPDDLAARIAENTRREPEWRARLENMRLLLEKYPDHAAARETLERGRSDDHPEVRLRAALASGSEGLATLLEMASLGSADDPHAAQAIVALGDQLSREGAEEILDRALEGRQVQTAIACLDRLARIGGPGVVALFVKALAVEEGPMAAAAARALGASGEGAAEAPLLQALGHSSGDVATAAAAALGRIGSPAAVLPLKEAAGREDAQSQLQRAVRQAVAEIQSRIEGASPGQVSLADSEAGAGQLSLAAEDPAGRVSLPRKDGAE